MNPNQQIYVADRCVSITSVLDINGISYLGVPSQIFCPVHKAGSETKRSARVFEDGFVWCYTCSKQYPPTEIHAACRNISRESAALDLLNRFPVKQELVNETLRTYHIPRKKTVPQAVLDQADTALKYFKHRVPLEMYRKWVFHLIGLKDILSETSQEHQPVKFRAFVSQMREDLNSVI